MKKHRIFTTPFASVYLHYIQKAEKKGRTRQEVDDVICLLPVHRGDAETRSYLLFKSLNAEQ